MRIFAGEWVSSVLDPPGHGGRRGDREPHGVAAHRGGPEEGRGTHFDSRKNLLEYDEVMDHQRKEVYGYRQEILEGANCKIRILDMIDEQIDLAVERFLDDEYGAASFAEFAANRLGVEFDAADFAAATSTEAEQDGPRQGACAPSRRSVQEMMEENLGSRGSQGVELAGAGQPGQHALGLKTNDRQLKQIGKDKHGRLPAREGRQVHRRRSI